MSVAIDGHEVMDFAAQMDWHPTTQLTHHGEHLTQPVRRSGEGHFQVDNPSHCHDMIEDDGLAHWTASVSVPNR